MRSPLSTSPRFRVIDEPLTRPAPGCLLPWGGHTKGKVEYAYCSEEESEKILLWYRGMRSPSAKDFIDQPK